MGQQLLDTLRDREIVGLSPSLCWAFYCFYLLTYLPMQYSFSSKWMSSFPHWDAASLNCTYYRIIFLLNYCLEKRLPAKQALIAQNGSNKCFCSFQGPWWWRRRITPDWSTFRWPRRRTSRWLWKPVWWAASTPGGATVLASAYEKLECWSSNGSIRAFDYKNS